ncbi:MAG TPA: type II toxin-antitoxin system PemK/MazF family toxin [Streptosporangiaceae bacterium]
MIPLRGQVYHVDLGEPVGRKPVVVVSNNTRNRNLDTVLVVRITTTGKRAHLPSIVPLSSADRLAGYALCDEIRLVNRSRLDDAGTALTPRTMQAISAGLRVALGLN